MKWKVESSTIPGLYDIYDEDGNRVVRHTIHERAHLIASAPDLLAERDALRAALEKIVNHWDDLHPKDRQQARAVLAAEKETAT